MGHGHLSAPSLVEARCKVRTPSNCPWPFGAALATTADGSSALGPINQRPVTPTLLQPGPYQSTECSVLRTPYFVPSRLLGLLGFVPPVLVPVLIRLSILCLCERRPRPVQIGGGVGGSNISTDVWRLVGAPPPVRYAVCVALRKLLSL